MQKAQQMHKKPESLRAPNEVEIEWCNDRWQFDCLADLALKAMYFEVLTWLREIKAGKPKRWLTLAGRSGVGKTHLANHACKMLSDVFLCYWPSLGNNLRSGNYGAAEALKDYQIIRIDDFTVEDDKSGFLAMKSAEIFNGLLGKSVIITTNQSLSQIAKVDERLADRMIRGANRVYEIETTSWSLR